MNRLVFALLAFGVQCLICMTLGVVLWRRDPIAARVLLIESPKIVIAGFSFYATIPLLQDYLLPAAATFWGENYIKGRGDALLIGFLLGGALLEILLYVATTPSSPDPPISPQDEIFLLFLISSLIIILGITLVAFGYWGYINHWRPI